MTEITIKNEQEVERLRKACRLAAETLIFIGENLREGMTTAGIDRMAHEYITQRGAIPAPLHYKGFPKSICTSTNEVVCHGIPDEKTVLGPGDIINVDVTTIVDGWHGDTSATFYAGEPSAEARRLVETARACLDAGVRQVREGGRICDIGDAIEPLARSRGCSVVRDFVGHGIGKRFHKKPQIPHFTN